MCFLSISLRGLAHPFVLGSVGLFLMALALFGGACSPDPPTPTLPISVVVSPEATTRVPTATPVPPTSTSQSADCAPSKAFPTEEAQLVWPRLLRVAPAQAVPGDEVGVTAMDGYLYWDNKCGTFYDESARSFELSFDGAPAGSVLCHAGWCQATLTVPADASSGTHVISVEGGSSIHVEVLEKGHDVHEPNDTREQATVMQRLTVSGSISHSEDVDVFRTPATYGGYLLDFTVELYDLPADYDLYVYDSANREIARSTNRGRTPEHIYYYSGPRTGNSYWLKVVGVNGASDPGRSYHLRFTMNPGAPTGTPTLPPTTAPTSTPDPCTGWKCSVTGVVYAGTAQPGGELAGATITLHHTSYCSPTRGVYQAETGPDGSFEFGDVFLHDTDRIRIKVESEGYESAGWDSVDRYCLYCSCFGDPLEIVLRAVPGP